MVKQPAVGLWAMVFGAGEEHSVEATSWREITASAKEERHTGALVRHGARGRATGAAKPQP